MSKSVVSTANERAHQIAGGLSCCYWLSAIHISPTISTQATTESPSIISPLITLLPGVRVGPPCWWVVGGRVGAQTRRQPASQWPSANFVKNSKVWVLLIATPLAKEPCDMNPTSC